MAVQMSQAAQIECGRMAARCSTEEKGAVKNGCNMNKVEMWGVALVACAPTRNAKDNLFGSLMKGNYYGISSGFKARLFMFDVFMER